MSISTTTTSVTYAGNVSTVTPYPIPFKYLTDADVSVYFDGVLQTLGAGQDYTITGSGLDLTGSIVTNVAQADTVVVGVYLDIALDQPVVLQETGSLPAKTIEVEGFDRLNMQVRRVWRKLQGVLTFNTDEASGSTGTADNLLGFDGSGDLAEIPNTTFEPAKGVDDNFVTDAEKAVIGNTSGTNTGDQVIPVSTVDFDPVGTDNSDNNAVNTLYANDYRAANFVSGTDYEPAKGVDDNFVTDAEKIVIGNTSGTNTGDQVIPVSGVDFDPVATDNSTDVTKAGTGTYVSLDTGTQVLTVDPIETSDINGFEAAVTANTSVAANTLKISATAANVKTGVEGASITDTGTPAPTDQVLYRDSISGDLQSADFADFGAAATDGDAIHKSTASEISALTAKATPIAGDFLVIEDSAAGNAKKSITIGNLPLPAAGTITEAMLNTSANLSLDKADTALQSIAADSITYDMIQDVATNNILGRSTGGTGTVEEISCTSAGRELLDDADASAQRTTLGVAIGSDVQAYSSTLDNIVTLPSVTDTASFTLLTNNITLTGVGLITGLAVGDVVEVSGSTSNDGFYTVDVITDDDNIIVNQAHANGTAGSGKTLTGETSTPSVTVTLDVKANHAPAGHGQAWIDVLSVRLNASTAYQNSTGRSIQIGHLGQDSDHLEISSDNVNWVQVMVSGGGGGNWRGAFPIVPNSHYYRVLSAGSSEKWSELR